MEMVIQQAVQIVPYALCLIGVLAFMVSIVTQVLKGVFKSLPTDILVFVLSIGITIIVFVAAMQYSQQTIVWYMILAAIMAGFVVAFIAMYGWEKFSELWKRFGRNVKE